eukprot:SAG31_NODE_6401_length_2032_cov_1.624418_1_plen_149_part_10
MTDASCTLSSSGNQYSKKLYCFPVYTSVARVHLRHPRLQQLPEFPWPPLPRALFILFSCVQRWTQENNIILLHPQLQQLPEYPTAALCHALALPRCARVFVSRSSMLPGGKSSATVLPPIILFSCVQRWMSNYIVFLCPALDVQLYCFP